jgi:hypothetical protein
MPRSSIRRGEHPVTSSPSKQRASWFSQRHSPRSIRRARPMHRDPEVANRCDLAVSATQSLNREHARLSRRDRRDDLGMRLCLLRRTIRDNASLIEATDAVGDAHVRTSCSTRSTIIPLLRIFASVAVKRNCSTGFIPATGSSSSNRRGRAASAMAISVDADRRRAGPSPADERPPPILSTAGSPRLRSAVRADPRSPRAGRG